MLVGHLGAGLAAKAIEPRLKLGTLITAAFLLDIVFWSLSLAGLESVQVPPDYPAHSVLTFSFPWSHSLLGAVVLSVGFAVAWAVMGSRRARRLGAFWDASLLIAAVVFSHWLLDWLVHQPDMLLPGGRLAGLGLWLKQPLALIVELGIVGIGLALLWARTPLQWPRKLAMLVLAIFLSALTVVGAFATAAPPPPAVFALSSLGIILLAIAVGAWADRAR